MPLTDEQITRIERDYNCTEITALAAQAREANDLREKLAASDMALMRLMDALMSMPSPDLHPAVEHARSIIAARQEVKE